MPQHTRRRFFATLLRETALMAPAAAALRATARADEDSPARPNVVFFLVDDMGWRDLACYGSTFFETPNIDRLAAQGMRFTDGYAACPVCSPTRASIVTGKHPARLHLTNFLVGRRWPKDAPIAPPDWQTFLPPSEVSIAERLKTAGYTTAHIGKWHLGGKPQYWPENQGFDLNVAGCGSGMPRSYFWPAWRNNPPVKGRRPGDYLPEVLTHHALRFLQQHGAGEKPFYLQFNFYNVHIPLQARRDAIEKYRRKPVRPDETQTNAIYAAMVEAVDTAVGRVLAKLDELGIADRTVILFTSDNGGLSVREGPNTPATNNAPLRAGKGYLYEGGIREPWIVKWPGHVKPGSICATPITSHDAYPTILEIAGVPDAPDHVTDGRSIVPLLTQAGQLDRDALYWHYPHYANQGGRPGSAVRRGPWKLIERHEDGRLELYNLEKDLGERHNLADEQPEKAAELQEMLHAWRQRVGAQMPRRRQG
jgi:arylsulfatase A-like enzyme